MEAIILTLIIGIFVVNGIQSYIAHRKYERIDKENRSVRRILQVGGDEEKSAPTKRERRGCRAKVRL